jgi:ApbE superfamily uncharacterized protein (UPF0280 family)
MYQERTYREWVDAGDLVRTAISIGESDLMILADEDVSAQAGLLTNEVRTIIEDYIRSDVGFAAALSPYETDSDAPGIIRRMAEASARYGVGPMAAVAGAVSEYVGLALSERHDKVIIENGGDIYARSFDPITMSLYAGEGSPFTGKVKFVVRPKGRALGICTSSGTVGHSASFGKADAVTVISDSATDADAAATALCNDVKEKTDVDRVIEKAASCDRISGVIVAIDDRFGVWGDVELV